MVWVKGKVLDVSNKMAVSGATVEPVSELYKCSEWTTLAIKTDDSGTFAYQVPLILGFRPYSLKFKIKDHSDPFLIEEKSIIIGGTRFKFDEDSILSLGIISAFQTQ